jgi:tetratricopeptide (TPR) repeat protein
MRAPLRPTVFLLLLAPALASLAMTPVWDRLPRGLTADSLAPALRALETGQPRPLAGAAAYALGQFHQARGEYRAAAEAFGRAAARLAGEERGEARHGQGLALLATGEAGRARAAFEEAITLSPALRPLSQWGLARALALAGETTREFDLLARLLAGPAHEAEPAALERYAALCDRLGRAAEAASARDRLLRRWPRSFEAARLGRPAPPPAP